MLSIHCTGNGFVFVKGMYLGLPHDVCAHIQLGYSFVDGTQVCAQQSSRDQCGLHIEKVLPDGDES